MTQRMKGISTVQVLYNDYRLSDKHLPREWSDRKVQNETGVVLVATSRRGQVGLSCTYLGTHAYLPT